MQAAGERNVSDLKSLEISVARVTFDFYPGGGGSITHQMELSKAIHPFLRHQFIVASDRRGEYADFDEDLGIPVVRIKHWAPSSRKSIFLPTLPIMLFSYARNVVAQILRMAQQGETIDIIHVHHALIGLFLLWLIKAKKLSIPVVIMQHGTPGSLYGSLFTKVSFILFNVVRPSYVLILDDGTRAANLPKLLNPKRVKQLLVHHGIDVTFFKPLESLPSEEFVVLSTSRFIRWKRVDLAISAFKKLLQEVGTKEGIRLVLAGTGPLCGQLQKLVADSGLTKNVTFLGQLPLDQVRTWLRLTSVAIATSLESNLNRSLQEAMACAKPVVVFDNGRIDTLIQNMKNGITVQNGDIAEFARRLKLLYQDQELRTTIGQNARETIVNYRSWKARVAQELRVYEEITGSGDGSQ
jgi:glycosyltransferase involved in cell wall biosynthesis